MSVCQNCGATVQLRDEYCESCGDELESQTEKQTDSLGSNQKAPTGVKIICVIAGIGAILVIISGYILSTVATTSLIPNWLGPVLILSGLLNIPMVYGLWSVKAWGWFLGMFLYGLNVLIGLIQLSRGLRGILGLLFGLIVISYLFTVRDLYLTEY